MLKNLINMAYEENNDVQVQIFERLKVNHILINQARVLLGETPDNEDLKESIAIGVETRKTLMNLLKGYLFVEYMKTEDIIKEFEQLEKATN